jgi:hypothetical protein
MLPPTTGLPNSISFQGQKYTCVHCQFFICLTLFIFIFFFWPHVVSPCGIHPWEIFKSLRFICVAMPCFLPQTATEELWNACVRRNAIINSLFSFFAFLNVGQKHRS